MKAGFFFCLVSLNFAAACRADRASFLPQQAPHLFPRTHASTNMKLDVNALRHLSRDDFRTLTAVEQGQKNVRRVWSGVGGGVVTMAFLSQRLVRWNGREGGRQAAACAPKC